LAGIGVGISSSVIPYVTDQLAMARLSRATYSLMVSLLPATAVVIGVVVLHQLPTAAELTGIAMVIGGVALNREAAEHGPRALAVDSGVTQGQTPSQAPPAWGIVARSHASEPQGGEE
jgi:inner membrane transporter RhtA